MKLILFLFSFISSYICIAQNNILPQTETTTYFFIRHAEKDVSNPNNLNPKLTQKGKNRAQNWANILIDTNIDYIYTTNYIRTRQTAKPIANSKKLKMILYDPKDLNSVDFQEKTKGKTTVVIGHSNTTPDFVNKVIGYKKYLPINEKVYGKIFIVKITGDVITDTLLHFN